jgi:sugar/nucleoside kinase (ribokinase family)
LAKGLLDSPVLVIGAAHVDVFADYNQKDAENLDKIGTVRFSVGGTAYNIAVNLGQNRIPVELITVIRDKSFPSIWIAERLESAGVATGNMQLVENARDSGFVAIRCQGELENAVTATAIGSVPLNTPNTDAAIQRAKLVVLDCNLPTHEIAQLLEAAHFARKPTLVAAVSDSKVTKLVERQNKTRFEIDVVVLNLTELRAVTDPQYRPLTRANATEICGLLGAKHVIVTMGADGHTVVTSGHDPQSFPAPTVEGFVSSTGAGDALTAGVLAYWYQNLQLDLQYGAHGESDSEQGFARGRRDGGRASIGGRLPRNGSYRSQANDLSRKASHRRGHNCIDGRVDCDLYRGTIPSRC